MNLLSQIYQVFPTVLGWVTDAIEFAKWISDQLYVNVYVALLNAIGIPVEIANLIVSIGTIIFVLPKLVKLYEYFFPFH